MIQEAVYHEGTFIDIGCANGTPYRIARYVYAEYRCSYGVLWVGDVPRAVLIGTTKTARFRLSAFQGQCRVLEAAVSVRLRLHDDTAGHSGKFAEAIPRQPVWEQCKEPRRLNLGPWSEEEDRMNVGCRNSDSYQVATVKRQSLEYHSRLNGSFGSTRATTDGRTAAKSKTGKLAVFWTSRCTAGLSRTT